MKSHEKKRLQEDRRLDQLLKTESRRRAYWAGLANECAGDSMISLLESTLHLPGDVIECGVYRGGSLLRLSRTVAQHAPEKKVIGYDSFEGFPEGLVGRVDLGFMRFLWRVRKKFRMCADTPERLRRIFTLFEVDGEIVKGRFSDTLDRSKSVPICFIHLDVDIYASYMECLIRLYGSLVPGGVVVFDDYNSPKWPGARKAVDEFFASRPETVQYCHDRGEGCWYVRKPE